MLSIRRLPIRKTIAVAGLATLAACATPEPPAPPPPPPPPVQAAIPSRPLPPGGASPMMTIPARGTDGIRETVNKNIEPAQATWNMRSGFNVAALNCTEQRYQPIIFAYTKMLTSEKKRLAATNKALDAQYRQKYGRKATAEREDYMTKVYNYFALPPAHSYFCEAALAAANNYMLMSPPDIDAYAATTLVQFEAAFEDFFTDYEDYRLAVQSWDASYGAQYGASQPGYVSANRLTGEERAENGAAGSS